MNQLVRKGRKIKIADGIYIIQKLQAIEGVIDENNNFSYVKNSDIIKLPPFDETNFVLSNKEYCYCDEYELNELIEQYPTLKTKSDVCKKFYKITNGSAYLILYDKEEKTVESVSIDSYSLSKIIEISDSIEAIESEKVYNDGMAVDYVGEYVITTLDTVRSLIGQLENDEVDDVIESLEGVCADSQLLGMYDDIEKEETKEEIKQEDKTIEQIKEELNQLIGMDNIKKQINKLSSYLIFLDKIKENKLDIKLKQPNLNMVFLGNPGTGKTTIARIISQILNKLGYANGKFKEVSAQDFIAGYVGQTALKTEKLLKEIHGGVLFIDEAYSLTIGDEESSYGNEAIAVLLKEMEKNETIFIFSGYKQEMEKFIKSNSGLTSRIGNNFEFSDYKVEELMTMFVNKINSSNFILDNNVLDKIKKIIENVVSEKDFGNGRFIDKLFDTIIVEHAYNTANSNNINELKTITNNDIIDENVKQIIYRKELNKKIGF